jgi:transcription initiation factor TFIID TATA-box-binding protein
MRKRTYTAIEGRNVCVSDDVPRVNEIANTRCLLSNNERLGCGIGGVPTTVSVANPGTHTPDTSSGVISDTVHSATTAGLDEYMEPTSSAVPSGVVSTLVGSSDQQETAPIATIHNLVGTCEIQSSITPIDLERVYRSLANSFYCRRRFAAITIRVTEPVCTGLLFTSGKLVITGCKTLIECVLASLKIVRMLERHIPTVTFLVRNAVVQNVVAHVVIPLKPGQRLNVDRLYDTWCCNCTFQKNMFPGLIFRPDKSPVVLLLFYSVTPLNPTPKTSYRA